MEVKAFFHPPGTSQAPEKPEYEVQMKWSAIQEIVAVSNAKLFNNYFLKVIDENKPVFVILYGALQERFWKFDSHLDSTKDEGNVNATPILSSNLGAMLAQQETNYPEMYFSVRLGDEEYFAGDTSNFSGPANLISLEDLIDFVAGEITWDNLRGRSFLYKKKIAKESSRQEKIKELTRALQQEEKRSCELWVENRFLRLENNFLEFEIQVLRDKVQELEVKLEKIPAFIRKTFFFFNRLANRNRS